nr:GGDEF domain-containing protein [uncultured Amphritea sp.]
MPTIHPKLIEIVIDQTPRAMIAMLIVSSAYAFIFIKYIPLITLTIWFSFQILLAALRFYNIIMFKSCLKKQDSKELKHNRNIFIALNIFQAFMWTTSSILVSIYAPQPFELVSFIMIIGIITAAVLSMSSLYTAYLVFFFSMIIPQMMIMLYYGEHQHISIIIFTIIYIPAILLLSKAILNSRRYSIEIHEKLENKADELHKLSTIDNLTNIYNRGYFFAVSHDLILITTRENKKASLLMIDIDHFKEINDSYGHQAGDFVLKNFAKIIKNRIRKSDIFARIGGEEFTILLNYTPIDMAKIIAEELRSMIEESNFIYNDTIIKITISIGIAELNEEHNSIESLYKQADKQLYAAKNHGRNRVCP